MAWLAATAATVNLGQASLDLTAARARPGPDGLFSGFNPALAGTAWAGEPGNAGGAGGTGSGGGGAAAAVPKAATACA